MSKTLPLLLGFGVVALATVALAFASWMAVVPGRSASAFPMAPGPLPQMPISQDGSALRTGIFVTGEGSVSVKPDIARVTLGVEVSNPVASAAQQEAAGKMNAVASELKRLGIEEKDIQTVRFDLSPEYDYSTRSPVLKGYRATNLVQVTVRDISRVGEVLDAVTNQGATRIMGIGFSVSDPAAAGQQGREEAMKNARAKAEQLAKLAGVTLGRPVSIEESVSAPPAPVEMRAAPAAAPDQTPISPGTQEVQTVVRVVYAIQ